MKMQYRITQPRKQGNIWVIDVVEKHGFSIYRRNTIRIEQAEQFLSAVFHGKLCLDYQEKIKQNFEELLKVKDKPDNLGEEDKMIEARMRCI